MGRFENLNVTRVNAEQLVMSGVAENATITVGTAAAGSQTCAIQLQDGASNDLTAIATAFAYISDSATGDGFSSAGVDSIAAGTDGAVQSLVTGKLVLLQSESDGDIDVTISDATSDQTVYLVLVLPNGKRVVSSAVIPTPSA